MIFITGDMHAEFDRLHPKSYFRTRCNPGKGDYLIVCGDFGLLWEKGMRLEWDLAMMASLPFTVLWVQGNHENYDMIAEYPISEWNGGKVRQIVQDKVILLERGQVFTIEGKTFFTFGGASCHDVQGGILDPDSPDFEGEHWRAICSGRGFRIKNLSWWEAELPTQEEMDEGIRNLEAVDYKVDYVITHCLSASAYEASTLPLRGLDIKIDYLMEYFDKLEEKLQYKKWCCGHYHTNEALDEKHQILYYMVYFIDPDDGELKDLDRYMSRDLYRDLCHNRYFNYFEIKKERDRKGLSREQLWEKMDRENKELAPYMEEYTDAYLKIPNYKARLTYQFSQNDSIVVQEKIDGCGAHLRVEKDGTFSCYSSNYRLNSHNNLQGFWHWCSDNFKQVPKSYCGIDIYGEWLVPHHCQYPSFRYGEFYVFDVMEDGKYWEQERVEWLAADCGFSYAPVLYKGKFQSWDHLISFTGKTGLGGKKGDGIVVKNQTTLNTNAKDFYIKL